MIHAIIMREMRLVRRQGNTLLNPIWFFLIVITLFPLSLSNLTTTLPAIAPAVITVAMLLALTLSLDRLFKDDFNDGSLEQFLLLMHPLSLCILVKIMVHWLIIAIPLLLLMPLTALLFTLPTTLWLGMVLIFLLATPTLMLIGAIGAALTVSLSKSNVLLNLIILPLYIPTLIFMTLTFNAMREGLPFNSYLAILAAMLILAVTLAPFAIAAALRISMY